MFTSQHSSCDIKSEMAYTLPLIKPQKSIVQFQATNSFNSKMTNLRVFALIAAFVCCEVLAGTQPFQLLIFRSTTTSRTTRLRTISNAPGFKDGWADEIYNVQMKLGSPG